MESKGKDRCSILHALEKNAPFIESESEKQHLSIYCCLWKAGKIYCDITRCAILSVIFSLNW
jgi:hypothetical protein